MSVFAAINDNYINTNCVTHIHYKTKTEVDLYLVGGHKIELTQSEAENFMRQVDEYEKSQAIRDLTYKVEGRLDDIITELAKIADRV